MKKELEELEEGLEPNIHLDLLRARIKKIQNWKMPGHGGIHRF